MTQAMVASFTSFDIVITPPGEEAAANALRVNDTVFVGAHFSRTLDLLTRRGLTVVPLAASEIAKLDAGLSCMSLRWKRAG
jgi:dimethylargininase